MEKELKTKTNTNRNVYIIKYGAFIYGTKLQAHHAQFIITHDVL